jgi:hypothetical protein
LIVSTKSSFLEIGTTNKDYNLHLNAKPKTPSLPPETMGYYLFFIYLFRNPMPNTQPPRKPRKFGFPPKEPKEGTQKHLLNMQKTVIQNTKRSD